MVIKWGKNGRFLCCSNYPECKNTMNFTHDENGKVTHVETKTTEVKCNKCGKNMIVKEGRFGQFLACSGYPECKNTMNAAKNEKGEIVAHEAPPTDEVCELCGKPMTIKRGRYGQFLGCTGYPECKNIKKMSKDGKVTTNKLNIWRMRFAKRAANLWPSSADAMDSSWDAPVIPNVKTSRKYPKTSQLNHRYDHP